MTCIVWDGEILAADSALFVGDQNCVLYSTTFNKIWIFEDFVFSVCGNESDYYKLEKELKDVDDLNALKEIEISSDSEAIIFWKNEPKKYFTHDGNYVSINKMKAKSTLGSVEDYAIALLQAGMKSEDIVKQCIKFHTGASGKVNKLNIREHFKWK